MPEQDNWKETFQDKFVAHITSSPGNLEHDRAVIFFEDIVKIESFIEDTLSSQARALKVKERMKQMHNDYLLGKVKREDLTEEEQGIYNLGIDDYYSRLLSAIESIEI